jgi:hypothetical protein
MQCPDCGAFVSAEDAFCGECGRPLEKGGSSAKPLTPLEAKDLPTVELGPASRPPTPPKPVPTLGKKRSPVVLILIVVGISLLVACLCIVGVLLWLGSQDGSTVTPTEGVLLTTPTNGPVAESLIFQDSFEDPASGWDVWNDTDTWADYLDGGYQMGVNRQDYVGWGTVTPTLQLTDFVIEVESQQVEGPLDNNYGLLVRYQDDDDSFYWFEISSDGYYSVDRMDAGDWVSLVDWEASDAIQQGVGSTNRLQVVCSGDQFGFFVNDTHLTDVTDDTFATGNIGLAVGAFDEEGVVVRFDNLKVYTAQN